MSSIRVSVLAALAGGVLAGQAQTNIIEGVPMQDATVSAQPAAGKAPQKMMSLEDCLVVALQHNFDIQIQRYNPEIARGVLGASYGAYDPNLALAGEHDRNVQPGGIDGLGQVYTGSEYDQNQISGGLTGLLPWGMSYNLGANVNDQWGTKNVLQPNFAQPRGTSTNYFTDLNGNQVGLISTNYAATTQPVPFEYSSGQAAVASLQQPLLRNFWIDQPRLTIFINKANLRSSEADFRDQVMATITSVETAYFNLISADENVAVQMKALELAEETAAEDRKRVEVGAAAPLDARQSESQAATSRADLLQALASRETTERVLKNLLSDSYTNEWSVLRILPTDKLLAMPQSFDLQQSWKRGLTQGPGLQQSRLVVAKNTRTVSYQKNQLYPELDLIGSYGLQAGGAAKEYSDAISQIRGADYPFWSVGAQMSIPLSQTAARNNYKSAKAVKEQSAVQLKQLEQQRMIVIENDIANARTDFERVAATHQARLYAEAALEAEQKKLENGKSTTFVVLGLQTKLTTARTDEINALAQYNIALAQLAFDEGATLERRKVSLEAKTSTAKLAQ
ncbi:MAG: TolC family protein [Verrucomicrobiota bacterium]